MVLPEWGLLVVVKSTRDSGMSVQVFRQTLEIPARDYTIQSTTVRPYDLKAPNNLLDIVLYTIHCTLYTPESILYTLDYILYTWSTDIL